MEFNNLRMPVGLYNSTIISCDIGNNVVIDNVNFMSHYILGNDVMIVNVNELATTDHSKFGNGVLKAISVREHLKNRWQCRGGGASAEDPCASQILQTAR